ncbi:hypothetical protein J1C86_05245 [Streptococcus sanguinis]|uniref:hypothetical protein n=1 Tax=Streptococcus sanguinis TaxID=1305 RepID=UPI003D04E39B
MQERIIKRSSKKILFWAILNSLFSIFLSYFFVCFIVVENRLTYFYSYILLVLLLILYIILFASWSLLFADKEFIRLTVNGFYYKPSLVADREFFSWKDVSEINFRIIRNRFTTSYRIEINFDDVEGLCKTSAIVRKNKKRVFKNQVDLIIPLIFLEETFLERIYDSMKYYEREWRIESNHKPLVKKKKLLVQESKG